MIVALGACGAAWITPLAGDRHAIQINEDDDVVEDEDVLVNVHKAASQACPSGYVVEQHEDAEDRTALVRCDVTKGSGAPGMQR